MSAIGQYIIEHPQEDEQPLVDDPVYLEWAAQQDDEDIAIQDKEVNYEPF